MRNLVVSYMSLRKAIGILGMSLAFIVALGGPPYWSLSGSSYRALKGIRIDFDNSIVAARSSSFSRINTSNGSQSYITTQIGAVGSTNEDNGWDLDLNGDIYTFDGGNSNKYIQKVIKNSSAVVNIGESTVSNSSIQAGYVKDITCWPPPVVRILYSDYT